MWFAMPLTELENELRTLAREQIEQGHLPTAVPVRTYGGHGTGDVCNVCGKPVPSSEVEYEIEEVRDGCAHSYHMHFLCHAAWQFESSRAEHRRQTQQKT
jgi:hypothetical protein